jgi:hypothetical protein
MSEEAFKYMFFWGPLMMFFAAVLWGIKNYGPPLFAAWQAILKETVSALNSANIALGNSTRAIEANSVAMNQHHETVMVLHRFFEDMKVKMEGFECPAAKPRRRRAAAAKPVAPKVSVRIQEPS